MIHCPWTAFQTALLVVLFQNTTCQNSFWYIRFCRIKLHIGTHCDDIRISIQQLPWQQMDLKCCLQNGGHFLRPKRVKLTRLFKGTIRDTIINLPCFHKCQVNYRSAMCFRYSNYKCFRLDFDTQYVLFIFIRPCHTFDKSNVDLQRIVISTILKLYWIDFKYIFALHSPLLLNTEMAEDSFIMCRHGMFPDVLVKRAV